MVWHLRLGQTPDPAEVHENHEGFLKNDPVSPGITSWEGQARQCISLPPGVVALVRRRRRGRGRCGGRDEVVGAALAEEDEEAEGAMQRSGGGDGALVGPSAILSSPPPHHATLRPKFTPKPTPGTCPSLPHPLLLPEHFSTTPGPRNLPSPFLNTLVHIRLFQ